MLLLDVVQTSAAVGATRSRKEKVAHLADLLRRAWEEHGTGGGTPSESLAAEEVDVVACFLSGRLRQRRTGVGWRGLASLPEPAAEPSLTALGVDGTFASLGSISGAGSQARRAEAVAALFGAATVEEQAWLRGVATGEVRQGALDALLQEAVAAAAEVPLASVRRAAMLSGSTLAVVRPAFAEGVEALDAVRLEVGRPVSPMLASSAPDVPAALAKAGGDEVAVDAKLDGIRVQVHRDGDDVLVVTRSLDDVTSRLPGVVEVARSLDATSFVLDGEALLVDDAGRPRPFQETASRSATQEGSPTSTLTPYFFDVLHLDGADLLDSPGHERAVALERLVPVAHRVARRVTADPDEAEAFTRQVLADGHEGVVVKDLAASYAAGRRGAAWVKVKPVHTLDLVVLAVEWGSGRRKGWLSNIHLGARDGDGFVMLGKTFKGMTDETLAWQTERFTELAVDGASSHVVRVRPEQVVEIAFDGVQRSTRYRGGVALRFARVVRYRDDKAPHEIDTIDTVRSML
ncbi:MAG: ATP-dependent DNA ligase [Nocardioides sp.]|nr:ATP-dependent DNA ligase [Nocardioides sp.]